MKFLYGPMKNWHFEAFHVTVYQMVVNLETRWTPPATWGIHRAFGSKSWWKNDAIQALWPPITWNISVPATSCTLAKTTYRTLNCLFVFWSFNDLMFRTDVQFFKNMLQFCLTWVVLLHRNSNWIQVNVSCWTIPISMAVSRSRMLHTVFAFERKQDRRLARNVALAQGIRNQQPGSSIRAPDGSTCACFQRASLLHVPSTMKLWPWVQKLFRFHSPPFIQDMEVDDDALFRARSEQGEELGGGFWGSEDSKDLESMRQGTLKWARDTGSSVVSGNCATTPTSLGNYAHVDFPKTETTSESHLKLKLETNALVDAHIFVGTIYTVPDGLQSMGFWFKHRFSMVFYLLTY